MEAGRGGAARNEGPTNMDNGQCAEEREETRAANYTSVFTITWEIGTSTQFKNLCPTVPRAPCVNGCLAQCLNSVLKVKSLVSRHQEKALRDCEN